MTFMPGFRAQLVACEPMVRQPVAIEFDDRGRLWVVQYLQYPNPEGLKRVTVDRYSRTQYDRIPDPPPRGPRGNDVITILEDKDGDGRMDASHNFVEGLNLCTGIAFGYGGVFVIQVPYLLFYPDKNRDDIPDGDPEVLLTGFGMEDAHSVANSLTWGPDGWLYGLQGSTVTAHINGIEFQQGVWRYHPVTHKFELFCEGGGNMWGLDFDREGNLFTSTNYGPYVGLHAVEGGYYWKQFGKHGALHNPYTFGYFEHMTPHDPAGGHVAVGGTIYDADAYPPEYRGKYIVANLLSHDVYLHELRRNGSTFETYNLGQFLDSHDTWFAPSDLTLGPDGAIYVADWCDKRTAHPDPDAEWDRSNGRIYRIVTADMKPLTPFDLQKKTPAGLVLMLNHPNKWFVRRALLHLAERQGDKRMYELLRKNVTKDDNPDVALNSLFGLYGSGGFDEWFGQILLRHRLATVRKWTVRFLGDADSLSHDTASQLAELAEREQDAMVRSQLACSARLMPPEAALPIIWNMLKRDADAEDPHIPLLLWWGIEHHAMNATGEVLDGVLANADFKLTRETVLPRLIRRYAADGSTAGDMACVRLLQARGSAPDMLRGLDAGLQDRDRPDTGKALGSMFANYAQSSAGPQDEKKTTAQPVSPELKQWVFDQWSGSPEDPVLIRLAMRLGNTGAHAKAIDIAKNDSSADQRTAMIELLGQFGGPDCVPLLLDIVAGKDQEALRRCAIDAVKHIADDRVGPGLLKLYPALDDTLKAKVRDALFTRAAWSRAFVEAVRNGKIPASDVPLDQVRVMAQHDDPDLRKQIEALWGAIRAGTPEEKLAEVRRLNNELNAGPGNPAKGKIVFANNCAKCHQLFGEGFNVAPELTQANRSDREYLLVSLVDPNLTVRKEYTQFIVETKDAGLFNGLIAEKTPGSITLVNANNVRTTISMSDVVDVREAGTSLMPEGLVTPLSGDDLRDLFAYLQGPGPITTQ